jgi:hypothetical protein
MITPVPICYNEMEKNDGGARYGTVKVGRKGV